MEKEWDIVEVLRHSRHDWLNKIQLIKGNLDMNRIDRVRAVIDEIIIEAQNETKLSNLQLPRFAALLLKTNWENPYFKLEYEVFADSDTFLIDDALLADFTESFFTRLNHTIEPFQENHLSVTIEPQDEGVRFFFDFSGIITNKKQIEEFLTGQTNQMDKVVKEFSEHELTFEVFMPLL